MTDTVSPWVGTVVAALALEAVAFFAVRRSIGADRAARRIPIPRLRLARRLESCGFGTLGGVLGAVVPLLFAPGHLPGTTLLGLALLLLALLAIASMVVGGVLSVVATRRLPPERIEIGDEGITRTLRHGAVERVRWDDLQAVEIMTTEEGPWTEDLFWVLRGSDGGCVVPGGAREAPDLLRALQRLPSFDNAAVVQANGNSSRRRFICWSRDWDTAARRS